MNRDAASRAVYGLQGALAAEESFCVFVVAVTFASQTREKG